MKDLKINKELIKAVLEKETETLSKDFNFTINEDYIEFSDDGEIQFEYCIYKFAFKCKEWAFSKGYTILTYKMKKISTGIWADIIDSTVFKWEDLMFSSSRKINLKTIYSLNEPSVIVESCEHILSEINK